MRWIAKISFYLRSLFSRRKMDAQMSDEIRTHLEMETEANVASGMSPEEARYSALREFGNVVSVQQQTRDGLGWRRLDELLRDISFAGRSLAKSPAFTVITVITLALAIGVNSAMFALVRDMVLRPQAREQAAHLAMIYSSNSGADRKFRPFSYQEFEMLRAATDVFSDVTAMKFDSAIIGRGEDFKSRSICLVSENYFTMLEVRPEVGRFFSADEARPNSVCRWRSRAMPFGNGSANLQTWSAARSSSTSGRSQ
ncbi:MAG TPA: permease prefix domain 1-containing protein [Lacunisphaera sp.]|jgi:hypothetical protein